MKTRLIKMHRKCIKCGTRFEKQTKGEKVCPDCFWESKKSFQNNNKNVVHRLDKHYDLKGIKEYLDTKSKR